MRVVELILSFLTLAVVTWYTYLTYKLLSTQTHQRIENKFFQLLRFHHDIVNAIQLERYGPAGVAPGAGLLSRRVPFYKPAEVSPQFSGGCPNRPSAEEFREREPCAAR
jgi:hypothetical protein